MDGVDAPAVQQELLASARTVGTPILLPFPKTDIF